jgi:hypothetical protein
LIPDAKGREAIALTPPGVQRGGRSMRFSTKTQFAMLGVAMVLIQRVAGADDQPPTWSVYSSDYYQLLYCPEREADARKIKGFLDAGIASLKSVMDPKNWTSE